MDVKCVDCKEVPADVFCLCLPQPQALCTGCIQKHYCKVSASVHDLCPIADLPFALQISLPAYKSQKLAVAQASNLLEKVMEQEAKDFQEKKETMERLFSQTTHLVDCLHQAVMNALQALAEDVKNSLRQRQGSETVEYLLTCSQSLMDLRLGLLDVPILSTLFSFQAELDNQISRFEKTDFSRYILSHLREAKAGRSSQRPQTASSSEISTNYTPVVMGSTLRKYYGGPCTLELVELSCSPRIDQESGCTFLEDGNLFCCGGSRSLTSAYIVGCGNGQVTVLPFMKYGRACPGVARFRNSPLVFGGILGNDCLTTCERFTDLQRWEVLEEEMISARSAFIPVLHNDLIYLPGGLSATGVEEFNPLQLTFTALPVQLTTSGPCVSFVISDVLYILRHNELHAVDLSQDRKTLKCVLSSSKFDLWSAAAPVVMGHCAYFWCYEDRSMMGVWRGFVDRRHGIFFVFNVETKDLTEVERFEYIANR